jgi:hypothetical protein
MMHCVQCDNELVAPIRSEYWSEKHACHIWHCAKCCACFSPLVSFSADTDTEPSLAAFTLWAKAPAYPPQSRAWSWLGWTAARRGQCCETKASPPEVCNPAPGDGFMWSRTVTLERHQACCPLLQALFMTARAPTINTVTVRIIKTEVFIATSPLRAPNLPTPIFRGAK